MSDSVVIWDLLDVIDEALIEDIQEGDHTTLATDRKSVV